MSYPACPSRQELLVIHANGVRMTVQRCAELTATTIGQDLTTDVCEACPVRELVLAKVGERAAPKLKFEETHTVRRKKPDATNTPEWLSCKDRLAVSVVACCGEKSLARVCNSHASSQRGQRVEPATCKNCPVRRAGV